MNTFDSRCERVKSAVLPKFSGTRVMMMPIVLGDTQSIPECLAHYKECMSDLFSLNDYSGEIGYLTIDEKIVKAGASHRRSGIHVDGIYRHAGGSWGGGWGGGGSRPNPPTPKPDDDSPVPPPRPVERPIQLGQRVSSHGTGFLTVSSVAACRAWNQRFVGTPGDEGECEHLSSQCNPVNEVLLNAGDVYWLDPLCVHESLPMQVDVRRQFVRLSYPSFAPWFEGYTENQLGVKPTGPILSHREFMFS